MIDKNNQDIAHNTSNTQSMSDTQYINEDTINIIAHNTDLQVLSWYKKLLNKNKNEEIYYDLTIIFDRNEFIESILESYNNHNNIFKQFALDFDRLDIYFNDKKINCFDDAVKILVNLNCKNNLSGLKFSALLCCQSSFYYSFLFLHKNLIDLELYCVVDTNESKQIYLYYDEKNNVTKLSLFAKYKITNINIDKNIKIINSKTDVDFDNNDSFLFYKL